MIHDRYLRTSILSDLKKKMIFVGGPRQVGKTTLSKYFGDKHFKPYTYLNWDNREDRQSILSEKFAGHTKLVIFDEIHKYRIWKNYLKGEFDKYGDNFRILVTGSARLDVYRRGGDSLMGRYHYYRLHPFSLSEVMRQLPDFKIHKELQFFEPKDKTLRVFKQLLQFGGFPEPFLSKDARTLRRFHNERLERLVKEDIRDVETIRDLSALQVLVEILPSKVGSLLSLNSLREDLSVAHKTVAVWMDILEKFYYHFRIYPFTNSAIRSLRKEPKMYLWDWSELEDQSARLENIIASHLLKTVHFLYDAQGYKTDLYFLRDKDGREVDFLVTINKQPWFALEVKLSFRKVSTPLKYFMKKLHIPFNYQITHEPGNDFWQEGVRVMSVEKFLTGLI